MLDLREWLSKVDQIGELKALRNADPELEIGTLSEINARNRGSALLFDEMKGYQKGFRLLTSALLTSKRLGITLGVNSANTVQELVNSLEGKSSEWESSASNYPPKEVSEGPVLENTLTGDKVNMLKFPAPLWNEMDGGRYLGTGDVVITRDPQTGVVNVGTYRIAVHDDKTLGIYISPSHHGFRHLRAYHSKGKACPVVISFGHHPLFLVVGGSAIPYGLCEYNYAGAVIDSQIEVIKGPITGLPIPANSEIAIEGFIPPDKRLPEGPFGEFTGYYSSGRTEQPIVEVAAVYHRDDPIVLGAFNCKPPHDYTLMHSVLKSVMVKDALRRVGMPEIKGVWFHECAAVNFLLVVSIKQMYPGHATQAGAVAAQSQVAAQGNGRYIVVVDDDIDPTNLEDVVWAICTRSNPETGIDVLRRTFSNKLDPIAPKETKEWRASRAIIDACRPFNRMNEFPSVVRSRPELREQVEKKWKDLLSET